MNTIYIIPARGGSKGIPKKNLYPLCGIPLIDWTIINLLDDTFIIKPSQIYLSTDSKEIARVGDNYSLNVIKRPKEISQDDSTTEDAIKHVLSEIKYKIDIVVLLQLTSPLRKKYDIVEALLIFKGGNYDSMFSASKMKDACIWKQDAKFESITYDYKNRKRRQEWGDIWLENGSIYIFKPEILEKYNNRLGGKIGIFEQEWWQSFELDDLEDVELIEYFLKKKILKENNNE